MKCRRLPQYLLILIVGMLFANHARSQEGDSSFAAAKDAFPTIETPLNDQGKPLVQTVHLNAKPLVTDGDRYSGFRFTVDRANAAEKLKVSDKTKMCLVWFFVPPIKMTSWYIVRVKGDMQGFHNYMPLHLAKFAKSADYLPANKNQLIVQQLPAEQLVEGEEYIIWFRYPENVTAPEDMSVALGYAPVLQDLGKWDGVNAVIDSLGLDLGGKRMVNGDMFEIKEK